MPFSTGHHEIWEEAETIGFVQPEEENSTGDLTAVYTTKWERMEKIEPKFLPGVESREWRKEWERRIL